MIYAAFFPPSVCLALCATHDAEGNCPLVASFAKTGGGGWGRKKQNKLGNFFKMDLRVSAHPCASLGTITPLFHFKFNNCTSSLKNMLKITHPCSEFSQKRCLLTKHHLLFHWKTSKNKDAFSVQTLLGNLSPAPMTFSLHNRRHNHVITTSAHFLPRFHS